MKIQEGLKKLYDLFIVFLFVLSLGLLGLSIVTNLMSQEKEKPKAEWNTFAVGEIEVKYNKELHVFCFVVKDNLSCVPAEFLRREKIKEK